MIQRWTQLNDFFPPVTFFSNFQAPVDALELVPADGNLILARLSIPPAGDRAILLSSDFVVVVENASATAPIVATAQIGVSNPTPGDFPLGDIYHGVLHSVCKLTLAPSQMAALHVIRLDIVEESEPWKMAFGADGRTFARLAPQVLAPAGTRVTNGAIRVLVLG